MRFSYHSLCGQESLVVQGELFVHLFRSRRSRAGEFYFRNMQDDVLYTYKTKLITKKYATLELIAKKHAPNKAEHGLHLLCAITDNKSFEKDLPLLNELGARAITLFPADFSQRCALDSERLHRIIVNSSQQCGRSDCMQLSIEKSLDAVLKQYPNAAVFDFDGHPMWQVQSRITDVLIGPEGGWSDSERLRLNGQCKITSGSLVLRASTAAVFAQANAWQLMR